MSHIRMTVAAILLTASCLLPVAAAGTPSPRNCNSADLRYPFMPGGPRTFGVFELRVAAGRCIAAHQVAKAWMTRFEAAFRAGHVQLPRSVDGFTFTTLPAHVAQTYRERGHRQATTIWFDYRIPNG
jgi:hypothetical protein